MDIADICDLFEIKGQLVGILPIGSGRTNDTYKITTEYCGVRFHYILQRINKDVFNNIEALMANIVMVTEYLKREVIKENGDPMRECLTLVYTKDCHKYKGKQSFVVVDNEYYRVYNFIDGAHSSNRPRSERDFSEFARSYADNLKRLSVFPAANLNVVIPNFHNTPRRINSLKLAVKNDKVGRAASAKDEIKFAMEREKFVGQITSMLEVRAIPMRVTHNDFRFGNMLFDDETGKGLAVIDLDTTMPGSLLYDFGDAIRYGCNTASENETDLTKIHFDIGLYKAFTGAFVTEMQRFLTPLERKFLPYAARLMMFECGIRYLTDYLNGDLFHKINYNTENLHRARAQFELANQIHAVMPELAEWTYSICEVKI